MSAKNAITKEELRKEINAILTGADLQVMSSKKVRQQLEKKLNCKLISRKSEIDALVMEYVDRERDESEEDASEDDDEESDEDKTQKKRGSTGKKPAAKKSKPAKESGDEESGSDQSDVESDDEYSPKVNKPIKTRKLPPKKKGEATEKKRGGSGYTKTCNLSPELSALVGKNMMARHEVVKKVWAIIKERNLYDPKNKQYAICDDDLMKVIGVQRFRTFGMMKYLKTHFVD